MTLVVTLRCGLVFLTLTSLFLIFHCPACWLGLREVTDRGVAVEIQVPHDPGSPVCFGPLLMKQDFLLGDGDRVGPRGGGVPGVNCLSV